MRRAVFALLGTTIGTSLLIGAKLGQPSRTDAQVTVDTAGAAAADTPSGAPADPSGAAPSGGPSAKASAAGKHSSKPTASRSKTPTGTRTTAAAPKPNGLASGTFTGRGFTHDYGTVQVTITVSGGVVTKASATYPTDRSTSRQINERAVPTLNASAVAAKTSANISTVSGATLTSGAYKSSLQSALDKAKA
ncbi:FMN-binding protein [Plantactinospora siamensis]|uniref:FMN-binding protein n=1 Tax=Plantactinospora siamensis TaxID=555372 RepID=A0ABV6NTM6_9ACTN